MTDSVCPEFGEFYAACTGRDPLPWQGRLAERVVVEGWPSEIGVPTGLGKTACIDIGVWSLAYEAAVSPWERRLPTRVWYVVNRRLLVDEAFLHAEQLGRWFAAALKGSLDRDVELRAMHSNEVALKNAVEAISTVAELLRERGAVAHRNGPLFVSQLRGGLSRTELPSDPAHPAVICSTVPMFGSRLLFRGYGGGRAVRPIQTALAAMDSLVLLDEAHLSQPLMTLVDQMRQADLAEHRVLGSDGRSGPQLVSVTATGDAPDRFELDEQDFAHPVVRQRLGAPKPTTLLPSTVSSHDRTLSSATVAELSADRAVASVAYVNSPKRATAVAALIRADLRKAKVDAEVRVLTGRLRPRDAANAAKALMSVARSGRDRSALERNLVVVATQTLEVGADVDFDVLVTETCGARALVQRLGRLNRLGDPACQPKAILVHPADAKPDGLYGEEPAVVWRRLLTAEQQKAGSLDLGPGNIVAALGAFEDRSPRSPELLPNHLDEWVKTSSTIVGEAPVDVFINGISDDVQRRCQVMWRAADDLATCEEGQTSVEVFPRPLSDEAVEIPVPELQRFADDKSWEFVWRLDSDASSVSACAVDQLRDGDVVVLPAKAGGYDVAVGGWDRESGVEVADLSSRIEGSLDDRAIDARPLRIDRGTVRNLLLGSDADGQDTIDAAAALVASMASDDERASSAEVAGFVTEVLAPALGLVGLRVPSRRLRSRLRWSGSAWCVSPELVATVAWAGADADALDELSSAASSVELGPHMAAVGDVAQRIAERLGLSESLVLAVQNAGRLHDLGKAEPSFQRWLHAGDLEGDDPDRLLAKSGLPRALWQQSRVAADWPAGGRHELISVQMIRSEAMHEWCSSLGLFAPDEDLVVHLVASHHGNARPGLFGAEGGVARSVAVDESLVGGSGSGSGSETVVLDVDVSATDWSQPARFARLNRRYGRWGLALLEAVLRQADWVVSARSAQTIETKEGVV